MYPYTRIRYKYNYTLNQIPLNKYKDTTHFSVVVVVSDVKINFYKN